MIKKIGIVGTRGIPAKYGGFETFAQEVSIRLANHNLEVTVYCDKNELEGECLPHLGNVKLRYMSTTKSMRPLYYYFLSVYYGLKENDIILVAGTGGSFFYFINFFYKKRIVTNTDGIESRRNKWSFFKKQLIKLSEYLAIRFSDHLVADSKAISDYVLHTYPFLSKEKISTIEYGAPINELLNGDLLKKYNLTVNDYYLVVSRLEPENNVEMIINGYNKSNTNKPLLIIGNLLETEYVKSLLKYKSDRVVFIGGIYNPDELSSLRTGAFAYIHGHSVGGTNPSLLEALGSGNISICHDNIFNREVTNDSQLYFSDSTDLASRLDALDKMNPELLRQLKLLAIDRIKNYYTWENITIKYLTLFLKL